jgi:hypothetical protein
MGNGRPHDNPITDWSNHHLFTFPAELEDALRALEARGRLSEIREIDFDPWREAAEVWEEALSKVRSILDRPA